MSETWVRRVLRAELLSDAHLGSGTGGGGIDSLVERDRDGHPVIWASHLEGVLRDAARRLRGDEVAGAFFGRAGGDRQRAAFSSLFCDSETPTRVWRSSARKAFDDRAPKDDTLRVFEYVPSGTVFTGEVELPERDVALLERLVAEVDAVGRGRASGAGRVRLSLSRASGEPRGIGAPAERCLLLLRARDPLCITSTATPGNLIPSLAFVPGRALLGSIAAWLLSEGFEDVAQALVSGRIEVSDALPLPARPTRLGSAEVMPAPLSLQSEKPGGSRGEVPWWASESGTPRRLDSWLSNEKLKRPEDDLFLFRQSPTDSWVAFHPERRVRLRNGRPEQPRREEPRRQTDLWQQEPSLFAIEQIAEETLFLAEVRGSDEDMRRFAERFAPVLEGRRWLRVGRGGSPVEVAEVGWAGAEPIRALPEKARLTLLSDLLVRDRELRWRTALDANSLEDVAGWPEGVRVDTGSKACTQEGVVVNGFNGTSRLWRMPAAAVRRGSVFQVSGPGVARLAEMAARGAWLGERTHEGFGRFRLDADLPGVSTGVAKPPAALAPRRDVAEERVAIETRNWFERLPSKSERGPSLSQWYDLAASIERGDQRALEDRLEPSTAGARAWKHEGALGILRSLLKLPREQRATHARFFLRWYRAGSRSKGGAA